MKNRLGNSVSVTLFGESHGEAIGAVLDGLAPGIEVDEAYIARSLSLRRPAGKISTKRVEPDHFRILSGVYGGRTTGTPLCIVIPNENAKSEDYKDARFLARPGHADYTAHCKYHGFEDPRGGGHFSGRITAALVAAGAVVIPALMRKGIRIGTHIAQCGGISDRRFSASPEELQDEIEALSQSSFAALDPAAADRMRAAMEQAAEDGDSVGGVLETIVTGVPAGVGEPWFDSLESVLSHALFSIPAVKGVSFGDGFAMPLMRGSEANDCFAMRGGRVVTRTNHNGGINGGISNGMPILFQCAVKPTPSIFKEQDTVDFSKGTEEKLVICGRHDPAIVHRARIVADSVCALVLCDMLAQRYGTDWLAMPCCADREEERKQSRRP